MTPKDNFIHICNLTTTVMGLPKGSLAYKSRKTELQVLSRHRASIYHYEKCHQGNYTWEKYRDIFNKVYMTYKQIEQSKKVFVDRYYMKEYLLKNGVKENAKNEVNIMLKSGRIGVVVTTSYMDFSNQLENIKFALRDYKYEMEIL